jgi:alpha-beta hydrolase superfamily lysophospholipase
VGDQARDLVLDFDVPLGGRVRTTWTAPRLGGRSGSADPRAIPSEARGWAWLQHGFGRRASALAGCAGMLASLGIAVVRPDIAWWRPKRSMHDATWLTAMSVTLARAVEAGIPQARGVGVGAPAVWTLVGHSAGGAVVGHAAACLEAREPGSVAILVLLDPVDTVGGLLAGALPALDGAADGGLRARSRVHACRPSRCNRRGATVADLRARRWAVTDHDLSHPDPERIPASGPALAPDPWAARLCGAPGSGAEVLALTDAVRAEAGAAFP